MSVQRSAARVSASGSAPRNPPLAQFDEWADPEVLLARASRENFPVALRILPREVRRHLEAIYGYARLTDNLGDEYPGDREAALDWVEAQLHDLFEGSPRHPVFVRLAPMVDRFGLSRRPFDRLLAANRLDQHKTGYSTWEELLEYCALSANPVGRLVLAVFESATPDRLVASDAVCTGLQVLEHLQDLGEDARVGRIYLPAEDMKRFGCSVEDLRAPQAAANLRELVAFESARARELLAAGGPLVASLRGYARIAIAGFVAGGLSGLDDIEAARYEVLGGLRQAGTYRMLRRFLTLWTGGGRRRGFS